MDFFAGLVNFIGASLMLLSGCIGISLILQRERITYVGILNKEDGVIRIELNGHVRTPKKEAPDGTSIGKPLTEKRKGNSSNQ